MAKLEQQLTAPSGLPPSPRTTSVVDHYYSGSGTGSNEAFRRQSSGADFQKPCQVSKKNESLADGKMVNEHVLLIFGRVVVLQ